MIWQYPPFLIPLVITLGILVGLTIITLRHRDAPGTWPVALFLGAATLWTAAYTLELASADLPANLFFTYIQYPGIVTVPVAWFLFVLYYTGRDRWLRRPIVYLFFVVPVLTLFFVFTNDFHHLYYTAITPITVWGLVIWVFTYGPLFWIHGVYSYALVLTGALLMVEKYVNSPPVFRHQISLLFYASIIPFAANVIYVLDLGPVPGFDLTPFAFLITGIALIVATIRFRLFSVMPVTYSMLVEHMDDGLVVVNEHTIIVAINSVAARLGGSSPDSATGEPLAAIIPPLAGVTCTGEVELSCEIVLPVHDLHRNFEVRCIPLHEGNKRLIGQLLIIRDITDQKAAAAALKEANLKLNILNDITRHDIRNKLTGLLLYVDTIRESSDPLEIKASVKKIEETALVLARQIEFTRTYQDLGVKSPRWQDLDALVAQVIPQVDFGGILFKSDLHRIEIYADPLFERVVYNLLENAVKFGGPKISFIRITAQEVPDGLSIIVEDDGVGIPEPDREKIFSRGYGTNTGLGLFLSREILAITGITIRETGEQGKGARFEILVPKGKYRSGSL